MDFNLAVTLRESARRVPDKPAMILGDTRISYAVLNGLSDLVAANLSAGGLAAGDRVGLQLPNIPEFVIAYFGILKAGGVVVPMNVLLKAPEIEFQLRDSGAVALISCAAAADEARSAAGARELELGGAYRADPQYGSAPQYTPVKNVRVVRDGETLQLGHMAVTAHYTPGHTPGSTSWTWTSCEGRRCLHVAYADSLSALAAPDYRFVDHPAYVAGFRKAIVTVAALPCDVLLTPHPDASGFWEKVARRKSPTDVTPLIDPQACRNYAAEAAKNLDAQLAKERATKK